MLERSIYKPDFKDRNNPSQNIVLVDQDDVLADFKGLFIERWQILYPDYPFIPRDQLVSTFIYQDYPIELLDAVESVYNAPGFVASLPPVSGGLDALMKMRQEGYIVKICTAQIPGNKGCLDEKRDWIVENLGKEWIRDLIISNDKTLIYGNILIDDKPEIMGVIVPAWEHVIFDAPHNKNVVGKRRLMGWNNWRGIINNEGTL